VLGLPEAIRGCLFDLDGVLTKTAKVHDAAWTEMFNRFLREWSTASGTPFVPFDQVKDYEQDIDGRPRLDGTRAFLASRGIELPDGGEDDPPGAHTVNGLSNNKNQIFLEKIRSEGVEVYPGSVSYVRAVKDAGLRRAVVSASANCREILTAAHIEDLFEVRIDGIVATREHLHGKPAPDTFLAAARELQLQPHEAVVYEDALAGVAAGRAGKFGYVIGVDRLGQAGALREHGADIVVQDLSELLEQQ
jgi:beta-phosphoglucomutase family hydrolase